MKVLWTAPAAEALKRLPASTREEITSRIEMISEFPEMYPVRARDPYAGFRYFFAKDWCVSYTSAEDALIILAIFHARSGR